MIEEQKGKWDGKMSADSMLKEERERDRKGKSFCTVWQYPLQGGLIGFYTEMQLIASIGWQIQLIPVSALCSGSPT